MSDQSGGPGWWQASDGLWYAPETHPDADYRAKYPAVEVAAGETPDDYYPVRLHVGADNTVARWRVLVQGIMAIPHFIIVYVLWGVSEIVGIVSWFIVLFTAKLPEGIHNFQAMAFRYSNRTVGFALMVCEDYPPFEFATTAADESGHSIKSDFDYQPGPRSRVTAFFRIILVIPHVLVLIFLYIGASVVAFIAWWAVLFLGRMPQGLRDFLVGTGRWTTRVNGYFWLLTDDYPPFSLD
ncbi:MAG: DUF4389 domain-containing protein [Acidimicrobiales bacterium]